MVDAQRGGEWSLANFAGVPGSRRPLGTPYILYVTAWLLLFGKAGPINQLYRTLTGTSDILVDVYSMPGMIMVEGFLWSPLAFLLVGATLRNANPELEEAARVSGAGLWATIQRVTLRLSLDRKSTRLNSSHLGTSYAV